MENQDFVSAECCAKSQLELYLDYLNEICCTYSHLSERLSDLSGNEFFKDSSGMIDGLIKMADNQLERLDSIYSLLGQKPDFSQCGGLIQFLEDNFSNVQKLFISNRLSRAFMLSYLQYSNSILMTSFQLIQLEAQTVFSTRVCFLLNELMQLAQKENALLSVMN